VTARLEAANSHTVSCTSWSGKFVVCGMFRSAPAAMSVLTNKIFFCFTAICNGVSCMKLLYVLPIVREYVNY
jgi:hypothetical protein